MIKYRWRERESARAQREKSLDVVDQKSKDLVENEPSAVGKSQVEHLRERMSRIAVGLQLSDYVDEYALFDGHLCVDGCDESIDFLKTQTLFYLSRYINYFCCG